MSAVRMYPLGEHASHDVTFQEGAAYCETCKVNIVGMSGVKVYVASSWRNDIQPLVVQALREEGHEVYDFKNPPGRTGFGWTGIDPNWRNWKPAEYREALNHPLAEAGFESDMNALRECDACVLVLPSGRSAHLEAGWAAGAGKKTCVLVPEFPQQEPELMARMLHEVCISLDEVRRFLQKVQVVKTLTQVLLESSK